MSNLFFAIDSIDEFFNSDEYEGDTTDLSTLDYSANPLYANVGETWLIEAVDVDGYHIYQLLEIIGFVDRHPYTWQAGRYVYVGGDYGTTYIDVAKIEAHARKVSEDELQEMREKNSISGTLPESMGRSAGAVSRLQRAGNIVTTVRRVNTSAIA